MLMDIESSGLIETVPYQSAYKAWRDSLDRTSPAAFDEIHAELTRRFSGTDIDTSSWIPGSDWSGTVFEPIYIACGLDQTAAAKFFGLIVWQVVIDMPNCWASGHYELHGVPIKGRTYFRVKCPSED